MFALDSSYTFAGIADYYLRVTDGTGQSNISRPHTTEEVLTFSLAVSTQSGVGPTDYINWDMSGDVPSGGSSNGFSIVTESSSVPADNFISAGIRLRCYNQGASGGGNYIGQMTVRYTYTRSDLTQGTIDITFTPSHPSGPFNAQGN